MAKSQRKSSADIKSARETSKPTKKSKAKTTSTSSKSKSSAGRRTKRTVDSDNKPTPDSTIDPRRIEAFVNQKGQKLYKIAGLARQLDVPKGHRKPFRAALDKLIAQGRIREDEQGYFRAGLQPDERVGIIKVTSKGFAFVSPTEPPPKSPDEEYFISAPDTLDALDGDEVLIQLTGRRNRGNDVARVRKVTKRRNTQFVGTYFERGGQGLVRVAGKTFFRSVPVGDPGAKGARDGDQVVIELLRFPSVGDKGEGVVTRVLGDRSEPGVDTQMIIHEFNLPGEFPEKVLADARRVADEFDDEHVPEDRTDFTKEVTVTIDPVDARDFDDAISLSKLKNGNWRLMVHVADVAHFVEPGSALDDEAKARGTSVYLPGLVIPMIPELISNGLASLQQGKLRYVKTAVMEFTPEGTPMRTKLHNGVIKVNKRFAYEEVLPIVREPEKHKGKIRAKVRKLLADMYEFAMVLRKKRFSEGALEMDLPEVKIQLGDGGEVVGAKEVEHDQSHQIIEEFMLAANISVATQLDERDLIFLRRIHPEPDLNKLSQYREFADLLGETMKNTSRGELQKLLARVRGTPIEPALNYALLRSFKQAQYSPEEIGHFALSEENYCHFTSPIRRYPDLTIHRIVDRIVKKKRTASMPPADAMRLGKHCTTLEKRAERAERELIKLKLLEFMAAHVGEEFDARITGVESFGIFCRGEEIPAEGLLDYDALEGVDHFVFEPESRSVQGVRTGIELRLGDPIRLKVRKVDLDRRTMDWGLVSAESLKQDSRRGVKKSRRPSSSGSKSRGRSRSAAKSKSGSGSKGKSKSSRSRKRK